MIDGDRPAASPSSIAHHTIKYEKTAIHKIASVQVSGYNQSRPSRRTSGTVSHSGITIGAVTKNTTHCLGVPGISSSSGPPSSSPSTSCAMFSHRNDLRNHCTNSSYVILPLRSVSNCSIARSISAGDTGSLLLLWALFIALITWYTSDRSNMLSFDVSIMWKNRFASARTRCSLIKYHSEKLLQVIPSLLIFSTIALSSLAAGSLPVSSFSTAASLS
mmetsp:Transcript_16100/g.51379  ORF Transcript_16100/g.51379 Transcript_16100/m.51379 type:complete len:218 (-) Transcript_16100:1079-1732(-)